MLDGGVDAATLSRSGEFLALSRFGVGYDQIDVPACTEADVVLLIAAGAVDRSMAEATVGWMIAITHHTLLKDRMVRRGDWERSRCVGVELRDRTLGVIGLGGIARETIRLLAPFGMRPPLAYDPYVDPAVGARLGVELVELDTLLARADFVSLHCPLNDSTRGLLGARELALIKPDAYLVNTARGGLVDEDALLAALGRRPHRRCRPRLFRRRAAHRPATVAGSGQRDSGPALHRLDRRAVPRHGQGGVPRDRRPGAGAPAARHGEPGGAGQGLVPGEVAAPADRARLSLRAATRREHMTRNLAPNCNGAA